jgi:2-haloacid dehalogenase
VLRRFKDIVVSGRVKMVKPDPAIFAEMLSRIRAHLPDIEAHELVFIDDNLKNAAAATELGWHGVHHTNAAQTEAKLRELGLPV